MNLRRQMMEATADLPTAAEMSNVALPKKDSDRPKTAVGAVAALSAAKLRIQELEEQASHGAIPVAKIRPNPWQPRKHFVEAKLRELAENIKEVGLLQPVLVRRKRSDDGQEDFYELIAGERRWRAHQINGETEIKALVSDASDADMAVMAVTENISREDLSDYEIGQAMRRAEQEFPNRKRMAEAMGISRSQLYRYLAFERLPDFMAEDLERRPSLLGGNAAEDIAKVLNERGDSVLELAREFWKQVVNGQLEQTKFASVLEGAIQRREAGATSATTNRDIHKVYAGKAQAGSITKDGTNFTVKLKSAMLTEAQEQRIRSLINELYAEASSN
ncbi:ParB/RepB/Spo0J family partition protein [Paraburkholderia sp. EG287A]|uniref:ParB/RepB/Spo0J family partition protein n=1 Tax=Paraburkholderia sp. EG287A TaxID=3237012 RepID=UPI0034D2742E